MAVSTLWTHGNSVVVEGVENWVSIAHRGWGSELTQVVQPDPFDSPNVVHVPLTTPPVTAGAEPEPLTGLVVLFSTEGPQSSIVRIDLWDGNTLIVSLDPPSLPGRPGQGAWSGDLLTPGPYNQPEIEPHVVAHGLNAALTVQGSSQHHAVYTVAAVGARFGASPMHPPYVPPAHVEVPRIR